MYRCTVALQQVVHKTTLYPVMRQAWQTSTCKYCNAVLRKTSRNTVLRQWPIYRTLSRVLQASVLRELESITKFIGHSYFLASKYSSCRTGWRAHPTNYAMHSAITGVYCCGYGSNAKIKRRLSHQSTSSLGSRSYEILLQLFRTNSNTSFDP